VNALDVFEAEITSVIGRGSFSNEVLLIGNCNDPTKSQTVYLNFDVSYPTNDCSGQMQVFYSYYDFPSNSYSDEAELCFMSSDKTCKGSVLINLGGRGEGEINVEEYVKLRGVCVSDSSEYTTTAPISINHFPINAELDALEKISEVDSILEDSETIFNDCSQCDVNIFEEINSNLNDLKYQISACDFTSYVARVTDIKNEANQMKLSFERISQEEQSIPDEIEEVEEDMDEVKEQIDEVKEEIDSKVEEALDNVPTSPTGGLCLIGLISPIILLLGFYLTKY